ncbi:MAG: 23S rRNA (adenine(2503)-C(2))-methyltransferase RlmN, partial [Pirellulaceae bacterium]|nr:23S rRNA (adenine(2503)-C(2))-methyltransferase RlmN [Pirellulaceae bacterium]
MTTEIDRSTIFAAGALEHFRAARRIEPRCMRRFRHMYLQRHRSFEESANELPERDRQAFLHRFQPHQPIVAAQSDSQLNGASKLALSTERGDVVESVLLRTPGTRTTLCVSSQVGCAARCEFCATG